MYKQVQVMNHSHNISLLNCTVCYSNALHFNKFPLFLLIYYLPPPPPPLSPPLSFPSPSLPPGPPATRVQQAQLFNDPQSNCDVMVATDAVGMGLNL